MQDIRIEGVGKINGGDYGVIRIDGAGECAGDVIAQTIKIDGKYKCQGVTKAELIDCDGMATFNGNVQVKTLRVDGLCKINSGSVEAEEVDCDGSMTVSGQISADTLLADGLIDAKEIVGDRVVIKSRISMLARLFIKHLSTADLIEATTIELEGVTARTVNGSDVTIGPGCRIETLDCSGRLFIHKDSTVKIITGDYTLIDP